MQSIDQDVRNDRLMELDREKEIELDIERNVTKKGHWEDKLMVKPEVPAKSEFGRNLRN